MWVSDGEPTRPREVAKRPGSAWAIQESFTIPRAAETRETAGRPGFEPEPPAPLASKEV